MKNYFKIIFLLAWCTLFSMRAFAQEHHWIFVATGSGSTYAIDQDGSLWSWGWNSSGELGIGTKEPDKVSTPTRVGTDNNWCYAAGGEGRAFFIKSDGTLWATGDNSKLVQGVGDGKSHIVPTQIGTDQDWKSVATSHFFGYFAFAIKEDGSLWAWGEGETGAIGNGKYNNIAKPIRIGVDNNWKQVSCGASHVLAVKDDGSLWMWGWNQYNSLSNLQEHVKTPQQYGAETDWDQVFAIENSSYAIKKDGSLWAWGNNENNSLGLNQIDLTTVETPRQVMALADKRVAFISGCSEAKVVGIESGGSVSQILAWGSNIDGALGDGEGTATGIGVLFHAEPIEVFFPEEDLTFLMLESGQAYTMALANNGRIYAWGRNRAGQLGNCVDNEYMTFEPSPIVVGVKIESIDETLTFGPDEIPSTLPNAKKIVLIGSWGTEDFAQLTSVLGNNMGFPPVGNNTLEEVDMSQITVKEKTSLYVSAGLSSVGVFKGCRALKTVIMPAPEQCANFSNFRDAFWNCSSLESFDLAGCSNVTSLESTFSNAHALKSVKNLKECTSVTNTISTFEQCFALEEVELPGSIVLNKFMFSECTSLKKIDWRAYPNEEAPQFDEKTFQYLVDSPETLKGITLIVPNEAFDSFSADENWKKFNLIKLSDYTGISSLSHSDPVSIAKEGSIFIIQGLEPGCAFVLYDLSGKIIQQGTVPASCTLSISKQCNVMILRAGKSTIKLL